MPKALGNLRYDPRVATPHGDLFDPWWLILEYESEILARWRKLAEEQFGVQLSYPRWGAHVTVIAGESPKQTQRWGFRDGGSLSFTYEPRILSDGVFYWLPVRSAALLHIRETLGVPRRPRRPFHMTLGRIK